MAYRGRPKSMPEEQYQLFKAMQPGKKPPRKIENSEFLINYVADRNKVISQMFYNGGEII